MQIKTVLFDLDGTLLDTLGDLMDAVNFALEKRGYPARTLEDIRAFVGNGVGKLMQRALPPGKSADAESCLMDFHAYYNAHMTDRTVPYAGISALIPALQARGIALAVLSNKYDPAAKALVQHYFGNAFSLVCGERPDIPRKPDPTAVHLILQTLHTLPENALYIGDSGVDMQTAKNAGLYAVGAAWGFRSRETLRKHGADTLIDKPGALLQLLQTE